MEEYNPWEGLSRLRKQQPVVHCINNFVSAPFVANTLLSAGASPIMAVSPEESSEVTAKSHALVINTGTPTQESFKAMEASIKAADKHSIPWVLDPVGVGISSFRYEKINDLLNKYHPWAIRANTAEIKSLAGNRRQEALDTDESGAEVENKVQKLASDLNSIVIASGEVDAISDGQKVIRIKNGHSMMTTITGTGCVASAVTGAFLAAEDSSFQAAGYAMMVMGITGQLAGQRSEGPASFRSNFIDQLYNIDPTSLNQNVKADLMTPEQ